MQKKDKTFVLKIFDIFNKISIDIVYSLSYYYKTIVFIIKPNTSRYANSEKIYCLYVIKTNTRY